MRFVMVVLVVLLLAPASAHAQARPARVPTLTLKQAADRAAEWVFDQGADLSLQVGDDIQAIFPSWPHASDCYRRDRLTVDCDYFIATFADQGFHHPRWARYGVARVHRRSSDGRTNVREAPMIRLVWPG